MKQVNLASVVFDNENVPSIDFVSGDQGFAWACIDPIMQKLATFAVPPNEGNTPDVPCFPKHQAELLQKIVGHGTRVITFGENIPEDQQDGRIH